MSNQILKISAATALLAAAPTLAAAQGVAFTTSPVAVTSCSVAQSYDAQAFSGPYSYGPIGLRASDNVELGYVNHGSVAATTVKFTFKNGSYTQNITANGTFAPGVAIERTFSADNDASDARSVSCKVAEVDFADGSAWHAGPHDVAQVPAR